MREVPGHKRKTADRSFVDYPAESGIVTLHHPQPSPHLHLVHNGGELEAEFDPAGLGYIDINSRTARQCELVFGSAQLITAWC